MKGVFCFEKKKLLRLWMSRSHFLPETICEIQKSEPLLHHKLEFFGRKLHAQIPSKLSSQNFWRWRRLKVPIVPMQRIFFWNFRCSTRSSVDDAKRTDLLSVQLNLRKVGTWNLLRWALDTFVAGVMEARLKLHPMTCIFEDTDSLWFLKDYKIYIR